MLQVNNASTFNYLITHKQRKQAMHTHTLLLDHTQAMKACYLSNKRERERAIERSHSLVFIIDSLYNVAMQAMEA